MATAAPETSPVTVYRGLVTDLNGMNSPEAAANFFNTFEEVVLNMAYYQNPSATPGVITTNAYTPAFFQTVMQMTHPVWIYINAVDGDTSRPNALDRITRLMNAVYDWFVGYDCLPKLKGFYLDNAGFGSGFNTRLHLSNIIKVAHVDLRLPIFFRASYPADLFTTIGPAGRGTEQGQALWPSIVGKDPTLTDRVQLISPLVTSWSGVTPTYNASRIAQYVALESYLTDLNVEVIPIQLFSLDDATLDSQLGLTVDAPTQTIIDNYVRFMRCCGYYKFGGAEEDYNTSNGKLLNDETYRKYWDTTDHVGTGRAKVYSRSDIYYVENEVLDGAVAVPKIHSFNASYAYQSSVSP